MTDAEATTTVRSARRPGTPIPARLTLIAALLGFFMICLDATAVNVALPAIGQSLGGATSGLQWVVDGYTVPFAALLISAGAGSGRGRGRLRLRAGRVRGRVGRLRTGARVPGPDRGPRRAGRRGGGHAAVLARPGASGVCRPGRAGAGGRLVESRRRGRDRRGSRARRDPDVDGGLAGDLLPQPARGCGGPGAAGAARAAVAPAGRPAGTGREGDRG